MHGPGNYAANSGDQPSLIAHGDDTCRRPDDIHHISGAGARAHSIPVRIERANRNWYPAPKAELRRPFRGEATYNMIARGVAPAKLGAHALQQRVDGDEKIFWRQSAQRLVPH